MVDVGGPEQPVPAGGAGAGAFGHQVPFEMVEQNPTQAASVSHPGTDGHTAATWFAHVLPGCIDRKQHAPFAVSALSALSVARLETGSAAAPCHIAADSSGTASARMSAVPSTAAGRSAGGADSRPTTQLAGGLLVREEEPLSARLSRLLPAAPPPRPPRVRARSHRRIAHIHEMISSKKFSDGVQLYVSLFEALGSGVSKLVWVGRSKRITG